jgi:subtilisin family serine protease
MRRIVLVRQHEWLEAAAAARAFGAAASALHEHVAVRGMAFDEAYHPVAVRGRVGPRGEYARAAGFDYATVAPMTTYCVRTEFDDEEAVERLRADRAFEVVGVYADPTIEICPPYCGTPAVGDAGDVARALGVSVLRQAGLTGAGVRVAVVDTGVDASVVEVEGGWSPAGVRYRPGSARLGHGTMCAWDVRIAARDARILDYALLRSTGDTWTAFLSDAIAAYASLIELLGNEPGPLVVNNSWGLFDRSEDEPIGSPGNYSANPDHPFNQIVASTVASGADILFAAGNCGADCPDGRCGPGDIGRGASIHGANSHPDVITVAAVTVTDRRLGYSSQGPGGLYRRKPDLAAYSHFRGSGVYPADGGTSAACPVAAGVAAALRQHFPRASYAPAQLKGLLQATTRDLGGPGWDYDFGYGVIDAAAAARVALAGARKPTRPPRSGRGVKKSAPRRKKD